MIYRVIPGRWGEAGGAVWHLDSGQVGIFDRQPGRVEWAEDQRLSSEVKENQDSTSPRNREVNDG